MADELLNFNPGRRKFVGTLMKASAGSLLLTTTDLSMAGKLWQEKPSLTVRQVIDLILKEVSGQPLPETVDTLKAGSLDQKVNGIATTTFATIEVIEKAARAGANFIIVHEPLFYNHRDETDWLKEDDVLEDKQNLLKRFGMAVWRFHDYWHSIDPDGVLTGLLNQLEWKKYAQEDNLSLINLPPLSLAEIIVHVKEKLDIRKVRFVGKLSETHQKVLLLPGAMDGKRQIELLREEKPDLLICGEVTEWQTSEYVRDARLLNNKLALLVLGHAVSEDPGMRHLARWLKDELPHLEVVHIPANNPFSWM